MAINRGSDPNDYFQTLTDIQANTEWETHGVEGDPFFWDYDAEDHDLFDGSWPDFRLTAASENAIDRGTTDLPDSLEALLDAFDVADFRQGDAYDIGRYEAGFALLADPPFHLVAPGGEASYALRLHPPDFPHTVTLTVTSPSPYLSTVLSSQALAPSTVETLTIIDSHSGLPTLPALTYTVPITATGCGFTGATSVRLFVGGARLYLPVILRSDLMYPIRGAW